MTPSGALLVELALLLASGGGTIPTDGCVITTDTVFEPGTYLLPHGIQIGADNITLDGNGAVLLAPWGRLGLEDAGLGGGSMENVGILIDHRRGVEIRNCEIEGYKTGIYAVDSKDCTVSRNVIHHNYWGLYLYGTGGGLSTKARIVGNRFFKNARGILTSLAHRNLILLNSFYGNEVCGISLNSGKNLIQRNLFICNSIAVCCEDANINVVRNNLFRHNDFAMYLSDYAIRNKVYLNTFLWPCRIRCNGYFTRWQRHGIGNYWEGYEECEDADGNGICDQCYWIDGNDKDCFALTEPHRWWASSPLEDAFKTIPFPVDIFLAPWDLTRL